jgi:hypothetical protein
MRVQGDNCCASSRDMNGAQQLLSALRDKFQGNPFVHSLWLAPLIITLFYYVGVGMKTVERSHDEWVARHNARNAAELSRKDQ